MPTRARQAEIAGGIGTSLNMAAGRGTVDPVPFPSDAIMHVTNWVVFTSGEVDVPDAGQDRAARAFQHHLELIASTDGRKSITPHREHPQLTSEPDA